MENDNHRLPYYLCKTIAETLDPDIVVTREMLNEVFVSDPEFDVDPKHMTLAEKERINYYARLHEKAAAGDPEAIAKIRKNKEADSIRHGVRYTMSLMINKIEKEIEADHVVEERKRKAKDEKRQRKNELDREIRALAKAGNLEASAKVQRIKQLRRERREKAKVQAKVFEEMINQVVEIEEEEEGG